MVLNYCSNCGQQINQGGKYCSNCGQKLFEKENNNSIKITSRIERLKSNISSRLQNSIKSKNGLVTIGIIMVAFIIILSLNFGKQSSSDVAEEFIRYTQEENYDQAKELWSQSGIDNMLAQLGDERWINQTMRNFTHRTDGDLDEFEIIKEEEIDSDVTIVYAKFIFDSGKRREARLQMIKEDGEWKVYAFGSN